MKRTEGTIVKKPSDALDSDKRMNLHGYRKDLGMLFVPNVRLGTAKMKSENLFSIFHRGQVKNSDE